MMSTVKIGRHLHVGMLCSVRSAYRGPEDNTMMKYLCLAALFELAMMGHPNLKGL
jgi:hypothetical protein